MEKLQMEFRRRGRVLLLKKSLENNISVGIPQSFFNQEIGWSYYTEIRHGQVITSIISHGM